MTTDFKHPQYGRVMDLIDEEAITWEMVGRAALYSMTEDEIETLIHKEEWFLYGTDHDNEE